MKTNTCRSPTSGTIDRRHSFENKYLQACPAAGPGAQNESGRTLWLTIERNLQLQVVDAPLNPYYGHDRGEYLR
jgi:hypothetical protein